MSRLALSSNRKRKSKYALLPSGAGGITFVGMGTLSDTSGSTSYSVDIPTFEDEDFAVMHAHMGSGGQLNNTPSGWDQRFSLSDNNPTPNRVKVWTRHLQTGDGDPTVTTTQVQLFIARIYVFRGVKSAVVIEDSDSKLANGNDVSPVTGCKLATADPTSNGALIVQGHIGADAVSYPISSIQDGSGFTEIHRTNMASSGKMAAGYRVVNPGSYAPINFILSGAPTPYPLRWSWMLALQAA